MAELKVPNVEVGVWPAFVITGKAGGALTAGQVAVSSDSLSFSAAGTASESLKAVVLLDGTKSSYALNDIVPLLLLGVAVVKTDAAVAVNALLETSTVAAAGQVRTYVIGADANDVTMRKVFARALTVGGTNVKALVAVTQA